MKQHGAQLVVDGGLDLARRHAAGQTTGFVESVLRLSGLDWAVPDFSTLSRRQKTLRHLRAFLCHLTWLITLLRGFTPVAEPHQEMKTAA